MPPRKTDDRKRTSPPLRSGPVIARTVDLPTRPQQEAALWAWVRQHTGDPTLVAFIARVIKVKRINARDEVALARAVQLLAQQHVKYFKEYPERWQAPTRSLAWGIGDCDDKTILIACALRSFRIPVRLVFLRMTKPGGKRTSHVYPEAFLKGAWYALESVREVALGWSPESFAKQKGIAYTTSRIGDMTPRG